VTNAHADTRVELSTGTEYSSGDFGDNSKTTVWYTPFSAKLTAGDWSFRATVPYLSITAPANTIVFLDDDPSGGLNPGAGTNRGSPVPGRQSVPNRTVNGIGDAPLSVTYSFDDIAGSPVYVDAMARVRLPTGDKDNGTGVGATDYALQSEAGIDTAAGGAYVTGGRRVLGSVPGLQRVDGWQAGVGASVNLGRATVLGAYYDWRDASERQLAQPREVGAYLSVRLTRAWKIRLDVSTSLEDGGPNYTLGMMIYWRTVARR
jgi:hypothetical protein